MNSKNRENCVYKMPIFLQRVLQIHLLCIIFTLMQNPCTCADIPKDAKTIVDSKFNAKTISDILLYRTHDECIEINKAIAPINGGKPLVDPKYIPNDDSKAYDDLLFALVNESMTVFSMFLGKYLDRKDKPFITMIFIQVDDREKLKQVYGEQHDQSFDDARRKQGHPYANALAVWAKANRDPDKTGVIIDTCSVGQQLEDDKYSWNKHSRDKLEYVLMKESINDSRDSIHCYGTLRSSVSIPKSDFIKDINDNIKNGDLADMYTSLVRYIPDENKYLAQVLHDHCDGKDNWSMWILILTTRRGDPMKPIYDAFQSQYSTEQKNITLLDYIKTCNVQDPQLKDMLTVLVDPASASKRQPPPPPPPPEPEPEPDCSPFDPDGNGFP